MFVCELISLVFTKKKTILLYMYIKCPFLLNCLFSFFITAFMNFRTCDQSGQVPWNHCRNNSQLQFSTSVEVRVGNSG